MTITPNRKAFMLETLQDAIKIVEELTVSTPCRACDHWQDPPMCMKFGATPPDDVLPVGCPEWVDGIPF
jgi:hypothetical protein